MVQEQLTDYISSQMKLGVSRDAIKSALVSAGWVAGDVDDTLKKVEGGSAAAAGGAVAQSAAAANAAMKPASPMASSATGATASPASKVPGGSGPQMIRVSDLVSSPFSGSAAKSVTPAGPASSAATATSAMSAAKFGGTIKGNSFEAAAPTGAKASASMPATSMKGGGGMGMLIMEIVGVIIILGLGGLAWYFYSGNAALAAKVASLTTQSASVTSQLSALQSQITVSSTTDAAQIASLTAANADLALNLSFYAVSPGIPTSTAATPLPVTISGSVSGGGKAPYAITTPRGAKIFIVNSTDATIAPELKAALGQTAQLSGTYVQGSDEMTVSSIATTTAQ